MKKRKTINLVSYKTANEGVKCKNETSALPYQICYYVESDATHAVIMVENRP